MSMRFLLVSLLVSLVACSDAMTPSEPTTPSNPDLQKAAFEMSARILGPAQNDDDADLRIALKEVNGVAAHLNALVLTCTYGVQRQWGAGSIVAEKGTNLIDGNTELVVVRHYRCPSSARPAKLEALLADVNGFQHQVVAAPFHPDWPGV